MNKINLLKLQNTKRQLENPYSSILCCKSYIFDKQFNTTKIVKTIEQLDKDIFERQELTTYNPQKTEDILLWFQTDKCKTPSDKLTLENFELNSENAWFKMINENRLIQTIICYSKIIINPLLSISVIYLTIGILLYSIFSQTYKIHFPLNSFINILKNSILLRNNLPKLIISRIEKAKYIIYTGLSIIMIHLGMHIYNIDMLIDETQVLYDKIKEFKRQIQYMRNITERLCKIQNDTLEYFMTSLNTGFYERSVDKCFLIMNRGRIISDYFKIANKKNKLGKLFKLNGLCSYMKLMNC